LRYTRVEVRKVGGVAHSLAWLTRLPTMLLEVCILVEKRADEGSCDTNFLVPRHVHFKVELMLVIAIRQAHAL
jgi:hypothetical protein